MMDRHNYLCVEFNSISFLRINSTVISFVTLSKIFSFYQEINNEIRTELIKFILIDYKEYLQSII